MTEKYCFTVGNEGQASLNILEKSFNDQTQYFLNKHGLKSGLSILDIGCGLGYMSQYLAEIVGDNGHVTAIDNSENQIKAAKTRCPEHLKNRIDWVVADIYELEKLNKTFDIVYCRFVLHHIHKPRLALTQISQVLKPDGIFIGIEGIINYAYSYPEQTAWPQLNFSIEVAEGENRNSNIGKILPRLINQTDMKCIDAFIYQPILIEPDVEFGLAENIARTIVNYDNIEPFIIIGIGYQDQDLSTMDSKTFWDKWTQNRARDYIPIQVSAGREDFEGGDHEYKGLSAHTGGSEKFKNFIAQELIPYVNQTYRTSNERALSGHSQGGLFATWIMLNHPSVFKKYIILGPSLWVEKGQMIKQANKLQSSDEITAYFSVGSKEYDANRSMVDEVKLFYSDLPKNKNFKSKLEIIDDENHVSMVPASLTKAFKFLFGK